MQLQSRQVYKVRRLPGEFSWAVLPQHDVSIDAIEKPKMENEYINLHIYDNPDKITIPVANVIIELYGIFYSKGAVANGVNVSNVIRFVILFLLTNFYICFDWSGPRSPGL